MKATISERRPAAGSRRHPKRRTARRAHSRRGGSRAAHKTLSAVVVPVLVEETPAAADMPSADFVPDKRDEELSDDEMLDREERQELY